MTAKEAVMSVDVERARLEAEAEELNDIVSNQEGSENAEEVSTQKLPYSIYIHTFFNSHN
jgi:hypothetical protein